MGRFDRRARGIAVPVRGWRGRRLPGGAAGWRRLSAFGLVAVAGLAVHASVPASASRFPGRTAGPAFAARAAAVAGLKAGVTAAVRPAPPGVSGPSPLGSGRTSGVAAPATAFRQIILADLLIVAPSGLTARQIASLHAIRGVRDMITFDGAQITAGGVPVNVIGVNPATFRSWVPLRTASDQGFWSALDQGEFVASTSAGSRLGLRTGASYQLTGATSQVLTYAMAARLGLSGIDLLVNEPTSRKLGLVRQVAGLISAPGVDVPALTRQVSGILGRSGRLVVLRSQQLPVASVAPGTRPANYLELFKASAALYCPGLSWTVLAAIGQIESADGTNIGPSSAGALGPMQFLPSTWAVWGIDGFGDTGPPNVLNPYDAVPAAARMLCADGAAAGGQSLYQAIFDYNHADWYVNEVLALAAQYAATYR